MLSRIRPEGTPVKVSYSCFFIDPINSEMEIRDGHEIGCEAQNLSADDNPPGFESMGDEIDGGLPLAKAEPVQPMESADTVSHVKGDRWR